MARSHGNSMSTFLRNCQIVLVAAHFTFSPAMYEGFINFQNRQVRHPQPRLQGGVLSLPRLSQLWHEEARCGLEC